MPPSAKSCKPSSHCATRSWSSPASTAFATWRELSAAIESPNAADRDALLDVNPGLRWIEDQVALLAPTELPVLIFGETGTGKALAARTIHRLSPRKDGPFLQVNCDQENATLIDSELFGHEEGAFTGARTQRIGKIELAQGGTLFLDQFISLPPDSQAKLFVLLKEGTFERVGGTETQQANVRIITATHADLDALVREGRCRNDLVLLLKRAIISMPALREKREAIPELAAYFAGQMAKQFDKATPKWSQEALEDLSAYDWPGNVAELEMRVQRAVVSCGEGAIGKDDLVLN